MHLKVEIKLSHEIKEAYAVIFGNSITEEIQKAVGFLEAQETIITANDNGKIVILEPKEIYMIRVEASEIIIYCEKEKYTTKKRLYELGAQLGTDFMQISKSAFINLKKIDCVEPCFNGMMMLKLKNNASEYISRKYLPEFKKYLGL
ncbi:MAG: LytTR family DNA-binding domain-containing protein [Clostridiales bacterium]